MNKQDYFPDFAPKMPDTHTLRYPAKTETNPITHYDHISRQEFEELKALVLLLQKQLNKVKIPI